MLNEAGKSALATTESEGPRMGPPSARSMLLTLLGEFVFPEEGPVWTSTLLHAFAGVGIGDKAARQALARAAAEGWIDGRREGRRTVWHLTPISMRIIGEGSRRVRAIGEATASWRGEWLVVHLSLPDAMRADRQRLYRALTWLGFGSPTAGLWICPHADRAEAMQSKIVELGLSDHVTAFQGRVLEIAAPERELVARAWDLDAIAETYDDLATRFRQRRPRNAEQTLFAHIELVNALQRLPEFDPGLPQALLPKNWIARRAARQLNELRAQWRADAHDEWTRISMDSRSD